MNKERYKTKLKKQPDDKYLQPISLNMLQIACSCFAILPNCGNSSGPDKQTSFWEIQWNKVLSTLSSVVKEFYDKNGKLLLYKFILLHLTVYCIQTILNHDVLVCTVGSEELRLKAIPVVEPQRTETCVLRINFLFKCLDLMLKYVHG
jgi:hypothetical protein